MAEDFDHTDWSRLAPPPRRLTPAVESFIRRSEFRQLFSLDSFAGYIAVGAGGMCYAGGDSNRARPDGATAEDAHRFGTRAVQGK
jgi:hypothetical protein